MNPGSSISVAQSVGYVAFVLGVVAFLQRDDRRLKGAVAVQALTYALHFALLGSVTAASSSLVTCCRALLALYTRSPWVAALLLLANVAIGVLFAHHAAAWLPILASCVGTMAFFLLRGIGMRFALLGGTSLWLTNNLLIGSVGGIMLEVFNVMANTWTIVRLWRQPPQPQP
jgi:hypothetical protein